MLEIMAYIIVFTSLIMSISGIRFVMYDEKWASRIFASSTSVVLIMLLVMIIYMIWEIRSYA